METQKEIQDVAHRLKESNKSLCRPHGLTKSRASMKLLNDLRASFSRSPLTGDADNPVSGGDKTLQTLAGT